MIQLVSLGAWCRPAHQIRVYSEAREDVQAGAFPFDWTITGFAALRRVLDPAFDPKDVLQPGHTRVSQFGSGVCTTSGILFHHAMGAKQMQALGTLGPGDPLPDTPEAEALMRKARERFQHTHKRLAALKTSPGPTVFVRWQRHGQAPEKFPDAFEGETPDRLWQAIADYLGHENFHLLIVRTEQSPNQTDALADPVAALGAQGRIATGCVRERPGWNGSGDGKFHGDEPSWSALFDQALKAWNLA